MLMVVGVLMACLLPLAANAQQQLQEWKTTSTMQMSGSSYSPQVTAVGSEYVIDAPASGPAQSPKAGRGLRKSDYGGNTEVSTDDQDPEFPIGDAVWPLMLMALAYMGWSFFRRRRAE